MIKRQFLHMVGSFVEVADQIQHITPNQFEQIMKEPQHSLLKQLYALEKEIYEVRMAQEGIEPGKVDTKKKPKKDIEEMKKETKPEETKKETKPEETKPEETKKEETKKKDTVKPIDTKQDKPKLEETKHSKKEVTKPDETKPDETKKDKKKPKKEEEKTNELDKTTPVTEDITWDDTAEPLCMKKRAIPKHIRTLVWNKHIGADNANAKCISCKEERIDCRNFHCGHVLSESKGGDLTITNLRPICSHCNLSMGTRSMNEFTLEFFGWEV